MATRYFMDIRHGGLGRFRRIQGPDRLVVEEKARLQLARWELQWQRVLAADEKHEERERALQDRLDKKELAAERDRVDPVRAKEIADIIRDLEQNVNKINEHGKRADSIVRGMLLHSRGKAGERQETDLNALLAEYTNLAYHGMRAQDQTFNVRIETDFDPAIGKLNVVPQDLSRAFLNIVNNACYAANDRKKSSTNGFTPVVRVSARNLESAVEIRIRDNGNGIPESIREKIFNPFFTTKPAGVGTGLGLSLSYDIITQVHKGEIMVDTREGEYTEFIITLPRIPAARRGVA